MSAVAKRPDGLGPHVTAVGDGEHVHRGELRCAGSRTSLDTLLLPVHTPWSTTGHLSDHVREVAPRDAYTIHDGALNDIGTAMVGGFLGERGPGVPARYRRLAPGATVRIGLSERAR
ncbi:hypothetical protein [Streptomyces rimosus]|uniref:hypothetical protein n=1 Tax=Streptomyces rimosus TaxID=1927 RepID=UPI0037D5018C